MANKQLFDKSSQFGQSFLRLLILLTLIVLLLTGCSQKYPAICPSSTPVGLVEAEDIAQDASLPFRFPLEASTIDDSLFFSWFGVSNECMPDIKDCYGYPERLYHAAEDYKVPAGTPVYAMADGQISFSGRAGGYGWLILIDHPQVNLYSLYGHLSPSRWKLKSGMEVKRGDLIAYLGNSDENGGSVDEPLEPHLHFGVRAGQITDYPGRGEWRFMAGWIHYCPQDLGWLQPSRVITNQDIPLGGYPQPEVPFLTHRGFEILLTSIYTLGGAGMVAFAVRKKQRFFMVLPGILVIAAGIVFYNNHVLSTYTLLGLGIPILASGIYYFVRGCLPKPPDQSPRTSIKSS